jgi:pimeloyl-ACP methyl ester carboxylesterase
MFAQKRFSEPSKNTDNEPLVIHRHKGAPRNRSLVIFVHGLGGRRYGKGSTWAQIPRFVFDDAPETDIGMHEYTSLFRRLRFWKSLPLEAEAEVLADAVRMLTQYDRIVLVGHSMGGLLALLATELLSRPSHQTRARVTGIVLVAVPQAGSAWVPRPLRWLSRDTLALARTGKVAQRTRAFIRDSCSIDEGFVNPNKIYLPLWALVAANDLWVDRFSAQLNVLDSQTSRVRGTHTGILKSPDRDSAAVSTLLAYITRALAIGRPETEWRAVAATADDLPTIYQLAARELGMGISSVDVMHSWLMHNRDLFWMVVHTTLGNGTAVRTVVGYFCLIPISEHASTRLRDGSLKGNAFTNGDILPQMERGCTIYVGGIVAQDSELVRQYTMAFAHSKVESWAQVLGEVTLMTRPITERGLKVADRRGFVPVHAGRRGLHELYWRKLR